LNHGPAANLNLTWVTKLRAVFGRFPPESGLLMLSMRLVDFDPQRMPQLTAALSR
jgi:hypothetical protein